MAKDRVRICDIADELGLSTATVSNVIHGKARKISDETVRRVQELLEKRQYLPGRADVLMAQNDTGGIGIIINNHEKYHGHVLEDAFVSSSLNHLSRVIEEAGYFMMIKTTTDISDIIRFASMWNLEGLVVIGFCEQDYKKLRDFMHIPFVIYDGYLRETERICNIAVDLIYFLARHGIRVPEDVEVAGFDDSPICTQIYPSLTSVRQNPERRAKIALEKLRKLRNGNNEGENIILPVELIIRGSTGTFLSD